MRRRQAWSAAAVMAVAAGMSLVPATAQAAPAAAAPVNLIKNHGAEKASPTRTGGVVPVKHWTPTRGSFTAVAYGTRGFLTQKSPGPKHRGNNFFAGGPGRTSTGARQEVSLDGLITLIRSGKAQFTLAGWLGGEGAKADDTTLTVTWKSIRGQVLGHATIGPVTEVQRKGVSELQRRQTTGLVPPRTSVAIVNLYMARRSPGYVDGFADNLSLTIVRK
jgi:hypothetical protein